MKRLLTKVVLPLAGILAWMWFCSWPCQREGGFDYFLYWIFCGFPFGFRRLGLWIRQVKGSYQENILTFAMNIILYGLFGGIVLMLQLLRIAAEFLGCIFSGIAVVADR